MLPVHFRQGKLKEVCIPHERTLKKPKFGSCTIPAAEPFEQAEDTRNYADLLRRMQAEHYGEEEQRSEATAEKVKAAKIFLILMFFFCLAFYAYIVTDVPRLCPPTQQPQRQLLLTVQETQLHSR
jgi:hypothetical protein